jgi:hypothetical protein
MDRISDERMILISFENASQRILSGPLFAATAELARRGGCRRVAVCTCRGQRPQPQESRLDTLLCATYGVGDRSRITSHRSRLTGNQGRGCGDGRVLGLGRILGVGVGRGVGVAVAVGVGVVVGVGLGLGGGVTVALGVGVVVGVAVGVDVGVTVGVGLGVGVGVGVGVTGGEAVGVGDGDGDGTPPGAWMATPIGEPVLKKPTVAFVGLGAWLASNRKLYSVPKRIALAF